MPGDADGCSEVAPSLETLQLVECVALAQAMANPAGRIRIRPRGPKQGWFLTEGYGSDVFGLDETVMHYGSCNELLHGIVAGHGFSVLRYYQPIIQE